MPPQDDKFQDYIKILDELQDRMLKAGLVVRHAHSQHRMATDFTPVGIAFVNAIGALEMAIGPLTNNQIICLWIYFREVAKERRSAGS